MRLTELTTVPAAALPVAGFKDHLRLGSGFADDGVQDEVLEGHLRAAMAAIEARTGKILMEREFAWTVSSWRDDRRQPLPLAPVSAIIRLVQVDRDGSEIVAENDRYRLEPDDQRPLLLPGKGACLPGIRTAGHMRIEMLAGFGPDWFDLPADLRQAVLMLASHYYEYRHEQAMGGAMMPYSVSALIERYRTVRIFLGGRT